MIRAILTCLLSIPLRQTRNAAIPISVYRLVQTGANNQLGGLKDGFARLAYQLGIEDLVKIEPIKPAS